MKTLLAGLFLLAVMSTAASVAGQESGPTAEPTVYTRNTDGRIETVTTPEGTTRYSYFPDGEIQQVIHPDGSREVYDYEELVAARELVARLAAEDAQASGRPAPTASTPTSSENAFDVSANRFAFASYYFDRETGLYHVGARYFDPAIGRFITADSNLGRMDDPPSLNRFVYGHDRPTYFVDPTGHEVGTAGCYFGPSSCSPFEPVPITGVEKRAFAGLVATAKWAGRAALGTLNLALGRGWEGFGERVITAASDPKAALIAAKEGFEEHVNTELDIAQERLAKGDDFGAALRFTEEVTAPTAATVIGAGELAVGAVRTGSRLLAAKAAASAKAPPTFVSDGGVALEEVGSASAPFVVGEQGLVPAIRGGSQGADALAGIRSIRRYAAESDALSGYDPVRWVDERAAMSQAARDYQSSAWGARSNVATRLPQAPEIQYRNAAGEADLVRFDGREGTVLIDRKMSVTTFPKSQTQALRQSEALKQNGLSGRWEVPTTAEKARADRMLQRLGVANIEVVVVAKP
jgi:RHS repeat-associated protein